MNSISVEGCSIDLSALGCYRVSNICQCWDGGLLINDISGLNWFELLSVPALVFTLGVFSCTNHFFF